MCVDDELDGLGRELFDLLNEDAGSGRLGVGVDDEDGVIEDDNRGVAIDFVGGLGNGGVDSVCDRLDVEQVVCQAGGPEKKEKNSDEHAVHGDISWQCRDAARAYHTVFAPTTLVDTAWTYCRQISPWGYVKVARYTCAEVSFGCRKRSIQYAQPSTIGKRMRSTVTRTWTLGGGAPLKLSNQSAVNTTMNVQSTR